MNAKFRLPKSAKHRLARMAVNRQVLVQKDFLALACADLQSNNSDMHVEQWLCKPTLVAGTDAATLLPGVLAASGGATSSTNSTTLHFMGGKASSILATMKHIGYQWEMMLLPMLGPEVLVMANICGVHLHHRAKLQVNVLEFHAMRNFSIAHLYRLPIVQDHMFKILEWIVSQSFERQVGVDPSDLRASLRPFL